MDIKIKSKFWLEDEKGRPIFGGGRRAILEKIDELGSIKAAAENLGISYRAVWGKIKTMEERLGARLVETFPGGGREKGARLTPTAGELIKMFKELDEVGTAQADALFKRIFQGK
ncbi:MAG: LysR family transcriptional regulator [Pseudomonadota bacterium]